MLATLLFLFFQIQIIISSESEEELLDMSIEDLMEIEIETASLQKFNLKNTPSIISIISKEDIKNTGARDLRDILKMIPGFSLAYDVNGVISHSFRGIWSYEGRILFMIDGMDVNENFFSIMPLGNRIITEQIERVEIIRSPGSSVYGGAAELAIVNIITKDFNDNSGLNINANYGFFERDFARKTLQLDYSNQIDSLKFSVNFGINEANLSDRIYTDFFGDNFDLANDGTYTDTKNLVLKASYLNHNFKFLYEKFSQNTIFAYEKFYRPTFQEDFINYIFNYDKVFKLNEKLNLKTKFNFKYNLPWQTKDSLALSTDKTYEPVSIRTTANILFDYNFKENLKFAIGSEFYNDHSKFDNKYSEGYTFFNGTREFDFNNFSIFSEILYNTKYIDYLIGGRYDNHSVFESNFAPRIVLYKNFDKFSYKLIINNAFRTPGVEHMNNAFKLENGMYIANAPSISPETAFNRELEFGYFPNEKINFKLNLFNMNINSPMIYFTNEIIEDLLYEEGYFNSNDDYNSLGFELTFSYSIKDLKIESNYSYFNLILNKLTYYSLENNPKEALSLPDKKFNLIINYKILNDINLNTNLMYLSRVPKYNINLEEEKEYIDYEPEKFYINVNLVYSNLLIKNLDLSFGVFNLLNQSENFFQPYNGFHGPIPGGRREIISRISYSIDL